MALSCPTCAYQNPDGSAFCVRCGGKIPAAATSGGSSSQFSSSSSAFGPNTGPTSGVGYQAQQAQQQASAASGSATLSSTVAQMGSSISTMEAQSMRHAFAGHGTLVTHHSWLLDGEQARAAELRAAIRDILGLRGTLKLQLSTVKLQEHGFWLEEREYIKLQRGVSTVFVYVAPAGQDLYISRATTVLPSFDVVRIILVLLAVCEVLFSPALIQGIGSSMALSVVGGLAGGGLSAPGLFVIAILALLYIPSILFLLAFLYVSFKHWITEKDFWAYLRKNTLNDFELDDIMLLEHITDDTVQEAAKQLHLDASKIVPPAGGYQARRKVRLI